ncbi:N-acetylmuramoyl-L-alanine amidase [Chishuiella sp.]|uniref:N-acetylmuramoyl-L-alanine amidase n=1 Tax=Chishuiella sp. TaxID=1969467 RepID=UPI0028A7EF69|nr:N-acetylmuramoyl-L-alanine amidase [Chishuiella sp.]
MNLNRLLLTGISCFIFLSGCATQKTPVKKVNKVPTNQTYKYSQGTTVNTSINNSTQNKSNIDKIDKNNIAKLKDYKVSTDYFPSISQDERVRFLVLHYTAINTDLSLKVLTQKDVSAHYLVNDYDDKTINLLVDETKRAWHAGVSSWKGIDNLNFTSIGIEIVNLGNTTSPNYYAPYPEYQIKKVGQLTQDIVNRYGILPTNVVGHSDIAPGRKPDPGPLFPWKQLYTEYGVGAWYDDVDKLLFIDEYPWDTTSTYFVTDVQNSLNKYGYKIPVTGIMDTQTKKVIIAFQMHFRPEKYDGTIDAETWAILKALNKKYNP